MISDDEYLERIVAGIQSVTTTGAEVNWSEKINGRQFDVVVRFRLGTLRYLVVVEVRHRTRKASASDMESFVTKARDHKANKAVFVSSAGFQQGAIDVAKRHGTELFTVTFDDSKLGVPKQAAFTMLRKRGAPPELHLGDPELVASISSLKLLYEDGRCFILPDEQSQMTYYIRKTKLAESRTLAEFIQGLPRGNVQLDVQREYSEPIDPPKQIAPPDDLYFPCGIVTGVRYTVTGVNARAIRGNVKIEPNVFAAPVTYTNVITGESLEFPLDLLPIGDKRVSVGSFYFICHPLAYYFCESIRGNVIHWKLIESFQNGELIRATMSQNIEYSPHYIRVTDKQTLNRLQARLEMYRQLCNPLG